MVNHYNVSLRYIEYDLTKSSASPTVRKTIAELLRTASAYDIKRAEYITTQTYFGIKKDIDNPPEYTHEDKIGHPWADDINAPLKDGEEWNKGRRATLSGIYYGLNDKGKPVNPYMQTGICGRGNYGLDGVNTVVHNGIVNINDNRMNVIGIIRTDNGLPAFSGGFVELPKKILSREKRKTFFIQNQVKEFFEEMISGSVKLLPAYEDLIGNRLDFAVNCLEMTRKDKPVKQTEIKKLQTQIITSLKYKQVEENNPEFIGNLTDLFSKGRTVYEGPILSSVRNTDNAWAETHLSMIEITKKFRKKISGDDIELSKFKAADDAKDVFYSPINSELVLNASGSNGPFMAYCLASYICNTPMSPELQRGLLNQCDELIDAFSAEPDFAGIKKPHFNYKNPFFTQPRLK